MFFQGSSSVFDPASSSTTQGHKLPCQAREERAGTGAAHRGGEGRGGHSHLSFTNLAPYSWLVLVVFQRWPYTPDGGCHITSFSQIKVQPAPLLVKSRRYSSVFLFVFTMTKLILLGMFWYFRQDATLPQSCVIYINSCSREKLKYRPGNVQFYSYLTVSYMVVFLFLWWDD